MARRAQGFIVAGTLSRLYLEQLLGAPAGHRYHLAYNCVDSERFAQPVAPASLPGRRNLLFAGRLIPLKGIAQLLSAYRRLVQEHGLTDLGLVLLGDGPLRPFVQGYAREHRLERIAMPGYLSQERLVPYYQGADAFVLLSLQDANPLVIFEALAAGLPIVCSERAGNAVDFVREGENGFVVDPLDEDRVVERLGQALELDRPRVRARSAELSARANYRDAARAFLDLAAAPAR
jgi:glycosyltransferase involved in cell wall biosynthesis